MADVHTQPTDQSGNEVGNVLHVGTGKINLGVFLAPNTCNPGQLIAYVGPVGSFHYEIQSGFNRLTDGDWDKYFREGDIPERPDWVASYLLDGDGNSYLEGRELKGSIYTETSMEQSAYKPEMDYLLVFPNPAAEVSGLRFLLNRKAVVEIIVYDALGRKVYSEKPGELVPAEYNLPLPVGEWQSGFYLVKVCVGSTSLVRRLVLR